MKRAVILLTLTALMAFAPSAFACWKCNLTEGCVGLPIGTAGRLNCDFDGACHVSGFCQGFTADDTQLAASYTVAAVHVVETKTEKAQELTIVSLQVPQPEPAKAEKAARLP